MAVMTGKFHSRFTGVVDHVSIEAPERCKTRRESRWHLGALQLHDLIMFKGSIAN